MTIATTAPTAIAVLAFLLAARAAAQIVPHSGDRDRRVDTVRPSMIAPESMQLSGTIDDRTAHLRVEQRYANHGSRPLEGTFLFPLPPDATIYDFAMSVDGRRLEAQILDRDKAKRLYEDIVRQQRDPALLEWVGRGVIRASLFPIPPGGRREIRIDFSTLLPETGGLRELVFPLGVRGAGSLDFSVDLDLNAPVPVGPVYSPTHAIDVRTRGEESATLTLDTSIDTGADFRLYFGLQEEVLGLRLLAHRQRSEEGAFMLFLTPRFGDISRGALRISFVLDTSGSMGGEKIEQATQALKQSLRSLSEDDEFAIIAFSDRARAFSEEPLPATRANIEKAARFLSTLAARGGTNIAGALRAGIEQFGSKEGVLVFLTDGRPTVGDIDTETIIEDVARELHQDARIFPFGVGDDLNTQLMDRLAEEGRGARHYVRPGEEIEIKVGSLIEKLTAPSLENLRIDFGGARVDDVYPARIPDLWKGETLTILGRYEGPGARRVEIRGRWSDGRPFRLRERIDFPRHESEHDYLLPMWASRKVAFLLDEMRLHGSGAELTSEVKRLSREYNVMTELTSFFVPEPSDVQFNALGAALPASEPDMVAGEHAPPRDRAMQDLVGSVADKLHRRSGEEVRGTVQFSESVNSAKKSTRVARGEGANSVSLGGVVFEREQDRWVDRRVTSELERIVIAPMSSAYFELIREIPELGQLLSVGEQVSLRLGDIVLVIEKGGAKELAPDALDRLRRAWSSR